MWLNYYPTEKLLLSKLKIAEELYNTWGGASETSINNRFRNGTQYEGLYFFPKLDMSGVTNAAKAFRSSYFRYQPDLHLPALVEPGDGNGNSGGGTGPAQIYESNWYYAPNIYFENWPGADNGKYALSPVIFDANTTINNDMSFNAPKARYMELCEVSEIKGKITANVPMLQEGSTRSSGGNTYPFFHTVRFTKKAPEINAESLVNGEYLFYNCTFTCPNETIVCNLSDEEDATYCMFRKSTFNSGVNITINTNENVIYCPFFDSTLNDLGDIRLNGIYGVAETFAGATIYKIGKIYCDDVDWNNGDWWFNSGWGTDYLPNVTNFTDFGGFINLGKSFTTENYDMHTVDMTRCTALTHESLLNTLNGLYAVSAEMQAELILGATNLAKLSDTEKAIATNKGWTLS